MHRVHLVLADGGRAVAEVGTNLGVEVVALVVVEAEPLGGNAVETVHVLLAGVVLVVGRVGRVDPDVVRRVLETELTRGNVGHPVAAVHSPVEVLAEGLVNKVGEDLVTSAGKTEEVDVVHTLLDAVVEVHGRDQGHRSAERVADDGEAVLVVLLHELLDLGVNLVDNLNVGVLEAKSNLGILRGAGAVARVKGHSREVDVVQGRNERVGVGALVRHGNTELVRVVNQGTLDEEAITGVPEQLGAANVHAIARVRRRAVRLLGETGSQRHKGHVAVHIVRLRSRRLGVLDQVRADARQSDGGQEGVNESTQAKHEG
mgnify:CR=1 FL=1